MSKVHFISQEALFSKMISVYFSRRGLEFSSSPSIDSSMPASDYLMIDLPYTEPDPGVKSELRRMKEKGMVILFLEDKYSPEKSQFFAECGVVKERDLKVLDDIILMIQENSTQPAPAEQEPMTEPGPVENVSPSPEIVSPPETEENPEQDSLSLQETDTPPASFSSLGMEASENVDIKILIADDANAIRNFVKKILVAHGYEVEAFENGRLLVDYIENHGRGDLILLDNQMPVMDGIETLKYLKNNREFREIPVLFLSAIKEKETVVKALEMGADDYMEKPFHNNEFLARIKVHVRIETLKRSILEKNRLIELEKEKADKLLLNTLPKKIVEDLKREGRTYPETFDNVTVYFSDIAGFTVQSSRLEPAYLINELNDIFTNFDNIMEKNSCERIKTIGDAYMAVCGMPIPNQNHAENMLTSSIEIIDYLEKRNLTSQVQWKIRIGIHTGRVTGGVVGIKKYIYDVFGDTINTASRMESNSEPMRINISPTTYELLKDTFPFMEREAREVKGKGLMKMYFYGEQPDMEMTLIRETPAETTPKEIIPSSGRIREPEIIPPIKAILSEEDYGILFAYYKSKELDKAIEIIEAHPAEAQEMKTLKLYGWIYYALKEYSLAAATWERALEINPEQPKLKKNLDTLKEFLRKIG